MRFEEPSFSEVDSRRADAVRITPEILAATAWEGIRAIHAFRELHLKPVVQGVIARNTREKAMLDIHYRMASHLASLRTLDGPIHFQCIAGSARSIFELGLDLALLQRDSTSDSCDRLSAFTRVERYRVAKKTVDFYGAQSPADLDLSAQRAFISDSATTAEVQALVLKFWGVGRKGGLNWPRHWSRFQDARCRARHAGHDWEERYVRHYYMLSWHMHSGMTGVAGLNEEAFHTFTSEAYVLAATVLLESFGVLGRELRLDQAVPEWNQQLAFLERVRVWAVLDRCLMSLGEPRRFKYLEDDEEDIA